MCIKHHKTMTTLCVTPPQVTSFVCLSFMSHASCFIMKASFRPIHFLLLLAFPPVLIVYPVLPSFTSVSLSFPSPVHLLSIPRCQTSQQSLHLPMICFLHYLLSAPIPLPFGFVCLSRLTRLTLTHVLPPPPSPPVFKTQTLSWNCGFEEAQPWQMM